MAKMYRVQTQFGVRMMTEYQYQEYCRSQFVRNNMGARGNQRRTQSRLGRLARKRRR